MSSSFKAPFPECGSSGRECWPVSCSYSICYMLCILYYSPGKAGLLKYFNKLWEGLRRLFSHSGYEFLYVTSIYNARSCSEAFELWLITQTSRSFNEQSFVIFTDPTLTVSCLYCRVMQHSRWRGEQSLQMTTNQFITMKINNLRLRVRRYMGKNDNHLAVPRQRFLFFWPRTHCFVSG